MILSTSESMGLGMTPEAVTPQSKTAGPNTILIDRNSMMRPGAITLRRDSNPGIIVQTWDDSTLAEVTIEGIDKMARMLGYKLVRPDIYPLGMAP